jgi:hypothetical protein
MARTQVFGAMHTCKHQKLTNIIYHQQMLRHKIILDSEINWYHNYNFYRDIILYIIKRHNKL